MFSYHIKRTDLFSMILKEIKTEMSPISLLFMYNVIIKAQFQLKSLSGRTVFAKFVKKCYQDEW